MIWVSVLDPPFWWSWLSWPTTLLTAAVGSCLYLFVVSSGLEGRRRSGLVAAGARLATAAAFPFLVGASTICADGASMRADVWVPLASGALWFIGLGALSVLAGVPAPKAWVASVFVLVLAVPGALVESIVALHTVSEYCDGIRGPLWLHTALSIAIPAVVVASAGGARWIARER